MSNTHHGDPHQFDSTDYPTSAQVRPSKACKVILGACFLAFSVFAWAALVIVPPPNPWMMGEVAFTRILIVYGLSLGGSLIVCITAAIADWKLKSNTFRWLALPCAVLLAILFARGLLGYPLSMG